MTPIRWLLGLIAVIVYYVRGTVCVHSELVMDSAVIEETFADGRRWKIVAKCRSCEERWTFSARTRHTF